MHLIKKLKFQIKNYKVNRRKLISFFGSLLLLAIVSGLGFKWLSNPVHAAWFDDNWGYRQKSTITNAGSAQTNFQVAITLDTATLITASKMQSDCDDLRITDAGGKLLPHVIEEGSGPCNNASTKIWVKIPSIPASNQILYIYYGNSAAGNIEDGQTVFDFFDNFNNGLNGAKWTATGATSSSGGALTITTGAIYTTNTFLTSSTSYMYEYRTQWASTATDYAGMEINNTQSAAGSNTEGDKLIYMISNAATDIAQRGFANDTGTGYNLASNMTLYTPTAATYYIDGFSMDSTQIKYWNNGSQVGTTITGTWTGAPAPYMYLGSFLGSAAGTQNITDITIDWVRARKFASTAPSAGSPGSEEKGPGPIGFWRFDEGYGTTINDSTASNVDGTRLTSTSSFGDGADGSITVSGSKNLNTEIIATGRSTYADGIAYRVVAPADSATSVARHSGSVTLSNGIVAGDEVLLINLLGGATDSADVGNYEIKTVDSVSASTITFTSAITKSYDGTTASNQFVVVQRIPNYTDVTVSSGGTITASTWDDLATTPTGGAGYLTGIVIFKATGTVSVGSGGTISVAGKGYKGGAGGAAGSFGGNNGESYDGSQGRGGDGASAGETKGGGRSGNEATTSPNNGFARGSGGGGGSDGSTNANEGGGGGGAGGGYAGGGGGGGGAGDGFEDGLAGGSGGAVGISGGGGGAGCYDAVDFGHPGPGGNAGSAGSNTNANCGTSATGGEVGSGATSASGGGAGNNAGGSGAGGGGGGTYGDVALADLFFGSGGGGGGGGQRAVDVAGANGQTGGGITYIAGRTVTVTGSITAKGSDGVTNAPSGAGGGGGGAGGSIYIATNQVTLGSSLVLAGGGTSSPDSGQPGGRGGGGGDGRVHVDYVSSLSGTSSPTADSSVTTTTSATWKTSSDCYQFNCLFYDGSDDVVTVANSSTIDLDDQLAGAFTFETWVRANSDGENDVGRIWSKGVNTYARITNEGSDGLADLEVKLDLATTDATVTITNAITLDKWQHISVAYTDDGDDEITVYIDGIKAGASGDGSGAPAEEGNDLLIGGTETANFHGFIDEFKIYNYERSTDLVKVDVNGPAAPKGAGVAFGGNQSYLSDGLGGYWNMDESSGSRSDSSGNGNTLTDNATVASAVGKFSNAADFEADNSEYLSITDNANLSAGDVDFTISAWVNLESTTDDRHIAVKGTANTAAGLEYRLRYDTDVSTFRFLISDGTNVPQVHSANLGTPSTGTWYFILAWHDSVNNLIYIQVNDGPVNSASATGGSQDTSGSFRIGASIDASPAQFMDGKIDDFRFYKKLLSIQERSRLYDWGPGPVGYWKMDENTGTSTTNDSSTSGDAMTMTSMEETDWAPGKYGSALDFDGSAEYLNHADDLLAFDSFTISAWIKPDAVTGVIYMQGTTSASFPYFSFSVFTSFLCVGSRNDANTEQDAGCSSFTVPTGQWSFVAVSKSGANITYYLNGTKNTSTIATAGTYNNFAHSTIGVLRRDTNASFFDGKIDDVRIYQYARSDKQIIEDMNAGHPMGGSPVGTQIIHYKLDEQQGTTINNSIASQAFTETMTGGTWKVAGSSTCKINGCLDFDGSDDVVTVTNADAIDLNVGLVSGFTISSWIYADSDGEGDTGQIWQKGTASFCRVDTESGGSLDVQCSLDLATTDATLNISAPITTASWNHVVMTWTDDADDEISIYINGRLRGTSSDGSGAPAADANNFLIGGTTTANFDGRLDEFKIYSAELSASEILIDMNAGSTAAMGGVLGTQNNEGFAGNPPVGWWKLDDNTGSTTVDSSGNGITGTITEAVWTPGKIGSALNFDGVNDGVDLGINAVSPKISGAAKVTVSAWANIETYPADASRERILSVFMANGTTALALSVFDDSGQIEVAGRSQTTDGFQTARVTSAMQGSWHHFTGVFDYAADIIYVYIDGQLQLTQAVTFGATSYTPGTPTTSTDSLGTSVSEFVDGTIDDVRIYNYGLTQAQISYIYNRGAPVALYKFDECQGTTANNGAPAASGGDSGLDGTITPGAGANTTVGTCGSGTASEMWNDGTTGKRNASLGFDGTDDNILVTDNTAIDIGSQITLSGWFNVTDTANNRALIGKVAEYIVRIDTDDTFNFFLYDGVDYEPRLAAATNPSAGAWHHFAAVYDSTLASNHQKLYIDGVLSSQQDRSITTSATVNDMTMGRFTAANYFEGQLDELRVYNYALTADQVKREYNNGAIFFGPATGSP
ncbi:MAG: DUF2341 domain-containing protein [bacterium]|nr:DUF2341 domain-containing protein [bacterium]